MRMYCGLERVFGLIAPSDLCIGSFASLCRVLTHTQSYTCTTTHSEVHAMLS